jgi:hypothetical protein
MTAGRIKVRFHDAVGAEWQDQSWEFFTVDTPSDELVDAVWDEVLTTATHDVGYSAGQRLRLLILTGAAAQGGTANSITLALAESATDHIFDENIVSIVAGLGAGQTRLIAEYVGGTRVATVDKAWDPAVQLHFAGRPRPGAGGRSGEHYAGGDGLGSG